MSVFSCCEKSLIEPLNTNVFVTVAIYIQMTVYGYYHKNTRKCTKIKNISTIP